LEKKEIARNAPPQERFLTKNETITFEKVIAEQMLIKEYKIE